MQNRISFTLRAGAAALSILLGAALVGAQTINIERYTTEQAQGGVGLRADYVLGADWDPTCCDPREIRWFQKVELSKTVPGFPKTKFIDPEPGQPPPTITWDTLPWYDVTYETLDQRNNQQIQRGKGRYMEDFPGGWGPFGPITFCATTLVVCKDDGAKTIKMLGGFKWGFSVAADGTITRKAMSEASDTAALRQCFNDALDSNTHFEPWNMVEGPGQKLRLVPEPASFMAMALGLSALAARRRRRKAAS